AHRRMFANLDETTCFVSVNFTDDQRLPWFKIDYPEVAPQLAAEWAPPDQRELVRRDAEAACAAAGASKLSFLGVRLGHADGYPQLKYYVDFPSAPEPATARP